MAEKEQVAKEKLEHNGIFSFKALYTFAHSWFSEDGYGVVEEKYSEKSKGNTRDILIEWKASKDMSDYFRFEYKIKFEIEDLSDVEVEIDGSKKQMNKGKITVEITSILVMDKDGKWEATPFNRFMRDIYNKYIVPSRVGTMKFQVSDKGKLFKDEIKSFLNLTARR